jgi:hypothetical protein
MQLKGGRLMLQLLNDDLLLCILFFNGRSRLILHVDHELNTLPKHR